MDPAKVERDARAKQTREAIWRQARAAAEAEQARLAAERQDRDAARRRSREAVQQQADQIAQLYHDEWRSAAWITEALDQPTTTAVRKVLLEDGRPIRNRTDAKKVDRATAAILKRGNQGATPKEILTDLTHNLNPPLNLPAHLTLTTDLVQTILRTRTGRPEL
jgi:hypothetical protein